METNNSLPDKASFNQAVFQQVRIDKIIKRLDDCDINPIYFNPFLKQYNYEIIFNDLNSLFKTISAKLKKEEGTKLLELRQQIKNLFVTSPPFEMNYENYKPLFNKENWELINDKLFLFRIELEKLMDIHGFGNPTKDNPHNAVFKGV